MPAVKECTETLIRVWQTRARTLGGTMADEKKIPVHRLRVGDCVQYLDLDDGIRESTIAGLVRGNRTRLIGFYPIRKSDVEPKLAITIDRIVKAWRPQTAAPSAA
jgi:hypothetical protein